MLLIATSFLSRYAKNNNSGTVAADFLELLLMFGIQRPEMGHFLQNDMMENVLKKLGQSIEFSYSNIQVTLIVVYKELIIIYLMYFFQGKILYLFAHIKID